MKKENKKKFPIKKMKKKTYNMYGKSDEKDAKAILSDPRFKHIASDPRYRSISNKATKIQIDRRFKDALTNERFNVKPTLDPRGRPRSYGTKEGLDKFYDLKSSEDELEDESDEESKTSDNDEEEEENESDEESKTSDNDEEEEEDKDIDTTDNQISLDKSTKSKKTDYKEKEIFFESLLDPERDLARGDTVYSDDSSDDDSSTTDEEEEQEKEFNEFEWGELDADAQWDVDGNEVEETNRFAVCDMDWDNVKAVDFFVLFSSFAPTGGSLKKVTIYPSEFGKTRMAEEDVSGPQELVKLASSSHKNKKTKDEFSNLEKLKKGILNENDDASTLEFEALRRYQRNRLKYYYAVVECDTLETAKAIYKECDRTYFEVIGVTLDLRYIPSDMEFDEVPHDVCEKIPASYENENIVSTALHHAKPVLTWDETDKRRKTALRSTMAKALKKKNFEDDILNDFVAVSGSDEEEEDESEMSGNETNDEDSDSMEGETKGNKKVDRVAKFRALISEIDEKEKKKRESTFTFEEEEAFAAGHERDSEEEIEERQDEDSSNEEEKPKEGETSDEEFKNLTPFEKMLSRGAKKKKERKLLKKKWKENKEINNSESDDNSESEDKLQAISNPQKKTSNKKKKNKNKENEKDVPKKSCDDLALLVMDEEQEDKKHFDMLKIKEQKEKMTKKKKRKKIIDNDEEIEEQNDNDFEINTSDSRFAALFTSGDFNMDPSHPKFDKHSSAAQDIMQKQKKMKMNPVSVINNNSNNNNDDKKYSKIDSDISAMIRKIKMKTSKLK